jgi:twinkle protein
MRQIHQSEVEDFTDKDLQLIYGKAEDIDVVGIEAFSEAFLEHLATSPTQSGVQLPWAETSDLVRLREGELSVWAGINGHQKSTVLSQCLVYAAQQAKVGLASFEMSIKDTAKLMCQQSASSDNPSREYGERFVKWATDRIYWYRVLGGVKPLQCLGAIVAMAKRGCKVIAIDNLQFTGVTDDVERERLFFNQLMGLAEALKVHICVVHHVRKPERGGDEYIPTRFDVRGGGTITDQAHLLFIVWHNKLRKRAMLKLEAGNPLDDSERDSYENECDLRLIVAKQRNSEFEGTIALYQTPGRAFKKSKNHRKLHIEGI